MPSEKVIHNKVNCLSKTGDKVFGRHSHGMVAKNHRTNRPAFPGSGQALDRCGLPSKTEWRNLAAFPVESLSNLGARDRPARFPPSSVLAHYALSAGLFAPSPQLIQSRESGENPWLQTRVLAGSKNGRHSRARCLESAKVISWIGIVRVISSGQLF